MPMILKTMPLGPFATNSFLVFMPETEEEIREFQAAEIRKQVRKSM